MFCPCVRAVRVSEIAIGRTWQSHCDTMGSSRNKEKSSGRVGKLPARYANARLHGKLGGRAAGGKGEGRTARMVARSKSSAVVFFCGIGGSTHGAQLCGLDVLLVVDLCPKVLGVCEKSLGAPTLLLDLLKDGVGATCERIVSELQALLPEGDDYDLFFQWSRNVMQHPQPTPLIVTLKR